MTVAAIIPARLASSRFPNKLLSPFFGKSILENVLAYARQLDFVDRLVLATDSPELVTMAEKLEVECFWCEQARCGTERSFRFFEAHPGYDGYLSIPADEPWIDPVEINRVWQAVEDEGIRDREEIITLFTRFYCPEDLESRLSCKIVTDEAGRMLYNSRSVIPGTKSGERLPLAAYKKHVGVFFFPNAFFKHQGARLWDAAPSPLADGEGLEQVRFLEKGFTVRMHEIRHMGFGIDSKEQVTRLEERLRKEE